MKFSTLAAAALLNASAFAASMTCYSYTAEPNGAVAEKFFSATQLALTVGLERGEPYTTINVRGEDGFEFSGQIDAKFEGKTIRNSRRPWEMVAEKMVGAVAEQKDVKLIELREDFVGLNFSTWKYHNGQLHTQGTMVECRLGDVVIDLGRAQGKVKALTEGDQSAILDLRAN